MGDVNLDADYVVGLIDQRDAVVAALQDALALVCLPEHAWGDDDDARYARCKAALANASRKET